MEALATFAELFRFNAGYLSTTLEKIPDPIGTFYRYSLPASMLRRKKVGAISREDK